MTTSEKMRQQTSEELNQQLAKEISGLTDEEVAMVTEYIEAGFKAKAEEMTGEKKEPPLVQAFDGVKLNPRFSIEACERFDKWMQGARERWNKQENSRDKTIRCWAEIYLAAASFANWESRYWNALGHGEAGFALLCDFALVKSLQEIPERSDRVLKTYLAQEKAMLKFNSIIPTKEEKQNGTEPNKSRE